MMLIARYYAPDGSNQVNLRGDDTLANGLVEKFDDSGRSELFNGAYADAVLQFCQGVFSGVSATMNDQIAQLEASALVDVDAMTAEAATAIASAETKLDADIAAINASVDAAKARRSS